MPISPPQWGRILHMDLPLKTSLLIPPSRNFSEFLELYSKEAGFRLTLKSSISVSGCKKMARPTGFEPVTSGFVDQRSIRAELRARR